MRQHIYYLLLVFVLALLGCIPKEDQLSGANGPIISSFSPVSGSEGTSITISGSNFGSTINSNTITIGGANAVMVSATSTQLVFNIPAGVFPGDYRISVKVGI